MFLLLSLSALAEEPCPPETPDEADTEVTWEPRDWSARTHAELATLGTPGDFTGMGGVGMTGEHGGFVRVDARSQATGDWVGRAAIGKDLFGRWYAFDLTLGAALATVGDWQDRTVSSNLGAGLVMGVGFNRNRLHLHFTRVQPFADSPTSRGLDESQVRLGFDVSEHVEVFGTSLRLFPDLESPQRQQAYGVGARVTF